MTFLKKLGTVIAQGAAIFLGLGQPLANLLGPKAGGAVSVITSDLGILSNLITQVEAVGNTAGMTGAQKFAAAEPLVRAALMGMAPLIGKKIGNPALFDTAVAEYTQATVDLWNSIHEDSVDQVVANPMNT